MNIKCFIGLHAWTGCKCLRCSKVRNKHHAWGLNCEICSFCGRTRIGQHSWNGCTCENCVNVRDEQHNWNGCKCLICGKIRHNNHKWVNCKCSVCEKVRDVQHNVINGICNICGHGTFIDSRNRKKYNTVGIGNQIWMAENLNIDLFRNGDPILQAQSDREWITQNHNGTPAWCYYEKELYSGKEYGKLYNWFAVTDPRGLAPSGWHIPTSEEWKELEIYLCNISPSREAGTALKSAGGWIFLYSGENPGGSDYYGFNGLPGGCRNYSPSYFTGINEAGVWWCSKEVDRSPVGIVLNSSSNISIRNRAGDVLTGSDGLSVRCIKD